MIDLDGTLVDSAPDMAFAVERMLERLGRNPVSPEKIRSWIGNGVSQLVQRALTGETNLQSQPEQFEQAYQVFSEVYEAHLSERSALYPGVVNGLEKLREEGMILACITNKHSRFTATLLERIGLARYFQSVACGDTYQQRKPHPMPLLKTAEQFNIAPRNAVMVGDSLNDIQAAKAAGFRSVCVPYGYIGDYTVDQLGADHVVESLADLPDLFRAAA
jgi:phosphoglycolate phosphatase